MAKGGKRPGAGRKSKAEEMGLKALLDKCFTPKERETVMRRLVQDASSIEPNVRDAARKLLLAYTFGQPTARTELTGIDGGPVETKQTQIIIQGVKGNDGPG
jgi:hypothetical protein